MTPDLAENAAVVIGNEGNGVCDEFIEFSDLLVTIPMEGSIESLNAAAAAAILMYESVRQRHGKAEAPGIKSGKTGIMSIISKTKGHCDGVFL